MVSSSRILTVSYGTFSCTLEGFDDPFSTMKSIAEYFRDLAADDRYFGAEPPQPDAEMLHQIAEREIQRRVEARVSEGGNGVVLRQADAEAAEPEAQAPQTPLLPEPAAEVAVADLVAQQPAPASPVEARVEAPVEPAESAAPAAQERAEPEATGPNLGAVAAATVAVAGAALAGGARAAQADDVDDGDADDENIFADAATENVAAPVAQAPAEDALDDILERALIAEEEDETSVAEAAPAETPDTDADIAALVGKMTGAAEDAVDAAAEVPQDDAQAASAPAQPEPDAVAPARRPIARVVRVRRPSAEDKEAQAPVRAVAEDPTPTALDAPFDPDEDDFTVPGESTLDPEAEAALVAELATVERESREALEKGELDSDLAQTPEQGAAPVPAEEAYEEDLEEDVAPASPLDIDAEEAPEDRIKPQVRKASRAVFDDVDEGGETERAIDRILAKTNSQLASGESSRRRNAIQHLKAAVQAKRADDEDVSDALASVDPSPLTNDEVGEDLAQVVRPRRPQTDGDKPKRRLAPLVLVSEQRIDEEDEPPASKPQTIQPARPVQPVRPRRIGRSGLALQEAPQEDVDATAEVAEVAHDDMAVGFRAFCSDLSVEGMDDSLEAATAFVTQEVGRPWATRPQIISLSLGNCPDATREDALESFVRLLKNGQIIKSARGQFVLSEESLYYE